MDILVVLDEYTMKASKRYHKNRGKSQDDFPSRLTASDHSAISLTNLEILPASECLQMVTMGIHSSYVNSCQ